jgi:hypothetical protein
MVLVGKALDYHDNQRRKDEDEYQCVDNEKQL